MESFREGFPARKPQKAAPIEVIEPTWARPLDVTLVGAAPIYHELHWDTEIGRTVVCLGLPKCAYCRCGMGSRPTGYVASVWTGLRKRLITQFSERALESLRLIAEVHNPLRGVRLRMTRVDRRVNAPVRVVMEGLVDPEELPPGFDVRPTLAEMWGLAAIASGAVPQVVLRPGRTRRAEQRGD